LNPLKIVGIVFVRNEERFIERAVANAADFCDEMLLVDRCSTDDTAQILKGFVDCDPGKFTFHTVGHPRDSHALLQPYVGKDAWIFAVDGDEIYDPAGLGVLRRRIMSGEFARQWMILGNVVHCNEVDLAAGVVRGYASPPSRSMVKLYNFAAIDAWDGDTPERLHGGEIRFREGFHEQLKLELNKVYSWDESPLRCLHLCFVRRSRVDPENVQTARESIIETFYGGWTNRMKRLIRRLRGLPESSDSKRERYARGEIVTVSTKPFFRSAS
jgi:glycosyltransferase involved in cell wall biosynthesis